MGYRCTLNWSDHNNNRPVTFALLARFQLRLMWHCPLVWQTDGHTDENRDCHISVRRPSPSSSPPLPVNYRLFRQAPEALHCEELSNAKGVEGRPSKSLPHRIHRLLFSLLHPSSYFPAQLQSQLTYILNETPRCGLRTSLGPAWLVRPAAAPSAEAYRPSLSRCPHQTRLRRSATA